MAHSAKLTDGTTSYEFVYDPSTQDDFKLRYGMRVDAGEPDAKWHQPDSAPPQLIRLTNKPVTIFLTTIVFGDNWDDVMNTVAPIKRWVDGDDQQAARYHTIGDVSQILCRIQLDGMTNYTDWSVIYGFVDDSQAYYSPEADFNTLGYNVVVALTCEPLGKGAPITLRNDLPSSPHCLEDSNSDGLPDGWTEVNNPTTSIYTVSSVIGGQCMRVDTSASGQGVYIRTTITASAELAAYVWVSVIGANQVSVSLRTNNGANTIVAKTLTATDSNAVSDKSIVVNGFTWWRVPLSGTASAHTNAEIRLVTGSSGAQVFFVDAAYLEQNQTVVPDAFASTSAIYNRNDPVTANPERINYVDVWGVPGDSDAVVKTSVTLGSVSRTTIMASRHSDGEILAANVDHWIESDELTTTSASGTWTTSTGTSDNHYQRFTEGGSPGSNSRAYISLTGSSARALLKYPRRLFALARSSSTTSQFVGVSTVAGELNLTDKTKTSTTGTGVATINTWELLDLGLINGYGLMPSAPPSDADQEVSLSVYVQSAPSTSTNDIDALLLPVLGDEFAIWVGKEDTRSSGGEIVFDGTAKAVVSAASGIYEQPTGGLWYATAGKMNRYVFAVVDSDNVFAIADTMSVSFTVYPRTRHLLGTL